MIIREVSEPEYSQRKLDEFEQRYGIESSEFYQLYRFGINVVASDVLAGLWAFEYEINTRAHELEKNRRESVQAHDDYSSPSYSLNAA